MLPGQVVNGRVPPRFQPPPISVQHGRRQPIPLIWSNRDPTVTASYRLKAATCRKEPLCPQKIPRQLWRPMELPPRKLHNLAYGIERIGLIPLRAPVLSAIILTLLCVVAAFGVHRLKVDNSLSQLFRSDTKEFRQYEEVTKRFPSTEFDVLVVIEGKNLMAREFDREDPRSRHRSATDRQRARADLAVLGAAAAGGGQASRAGVPGGAADRRRIRRAGAARAQQRDHPRQASVRGRHAGADRARARSQDRQRQGPQHHHRRNPQDHAGRPCRHRAHRAARRRADHAARNPQRGRARQRCSTTPSASPPAA